jgi:hypothetical protein
LSKKQKSAVPERVPTKRQLSKWQREEKIRRIVIIGAAVFLAGILSWVGYKSYEDYRAKTAAWREVVIKVNNTSFTMEYFVNMLDLYTTGVESDVLSYSGDSVAGMVGEWIIQSELIRQGAENLGIQVTSREIDAGLKERGWPNDKVYKDIVAANLSQERLQDYFAPRSPVEQAHVQVVLVESESKATEFAAKVKAGGNFTALALNYSSNSSVEGDLGWLPRELMPNSLIADVAFNLTIGEMSEPIYDETAGGYWVVAVVDRGERELDQETKTKLIEKRLSDWLEAQRKSNTIENLLTAEKRSWAVNKVLQRR